MCCTPAFPFPSCQESLILNLLSAVICFPDCIISFESTATTLSSSLLQDLHVDAMLNGLVLGESLLNDAVALVLCSSIEEYERVSLTTKGGFEAGAFLLTVAKFFSIFLGSVGLGAVVAFVTAILTKEFTSSTSQITIMGNNKDVCA